jgi:hypothetical protein
MYAIAARALVETDVIVRSAIALNVTTQVVVLHDGETLLTLTSDRSTAKHSIHTTRCVLG